MGVDHGRDGKTRPSRIWSKGNADENCPTQILSYKYKNERSLAFKVRQNPFLVETLPHSDPSGELTMLQQNP